MVAAPQTFLPSLHECAWASGQVGKHLAAAGSTVFLCLPTLCPSPPNAETKLGILLSDTATPRHPLELAPAVAHLPFLHRSSHSLVSLPPSAFPGARNRVQGGGGLRSRLGAGLVQPSRPICPRGRGPASDYAVLIMLVLLSRQTAQIGLAAKYTAYPELCRVGSPRLSPLFSLL